uniref:RRM domain-containing protein n=1 Tax=Glossina austeni TaxID=7395 RepID=A0A1A9UKR8_GLOAU
MNANSFGFFDRSIFDLQSISYKSYQENGTKYIKSRKVLDDKLQQQLNSCAGEIFLTGISKETRAEQIVEIASLLGELYLLRFKVDHSGKSRGFAYLQYMDPNFMPIALRQLPLLFRQYKCAMIRVKQSRNSCKLLLKGICDMSPEIVFNMLEQSIRFEKLVGREICRGYFEYQIIFSCNSEAVFARRDLLRNITKFGRNVAVLWMK